MWFSHCSFIHFVKDVWSSTSLEGWEGFQYMRKLRILKDNLKQRNKSIFEDVRIRKENIFKKIGCLDRLELKENLLEDLCEKLKS